MKYICVFAILILSGWAVGCFREATSSNLNDTPSPIASSSTSPATARQEMPIGGIDFRNFSYDWYPSWADTPATGRRIILKDGRMNLGFPYGKEPREFFLIENSLKFGDLNGDGNNEAVMAIGIITSGTARGDVIFVYDVSNEEPKKLLAYETGDRWDHGYHDAYVKDGQFIIERYKPTILGFRGEKHDMSSSNTYLRDYYRWNGTALRRVKTEEVPADPNDTSPWVPQNTKPQS